MQTAAKPVITPDMLNGINLSEGAHDPLVDRKQMCAMEAVSWLAGEPWGDHPQCVSPTIADFVIGWNDRLLTDHDRNKWILPLLPIVVGTTNELLERRRNYLCADYAVRVFAPIALEGCGYDIEPKQLRELSEVDNDVSADEAYIVCRRFANMIGGLAGSACLNACCACQDVAKYKEAAVSTQYSALRVATSNSGHVNRACAELVRKLAEMQEEPNAG